MDLADLERTMLAAYAEAGMPAWPSPRPLAEAGRDEEYSRVTDPQRYAVVHVRAAAWVAALEQLPDVSVERDGDTIRLASGRAGTAPLLLTCRTVPLTEGTGYLALLDIAIGEPARPLATWPDCGCDACDYGSDDLLEAVDGVIATAISGQLVEGASAFVNMGWLD